MRLRTPRPLATLAASVAAVLAAACQDQSPTAPAARTAAAAASAAAPSVDRTKLRAPAGVRIFDLPAPGAPRRAIDPDAYQCSDASPINTWYNDQVYAAYAQNRANFSTLYDLAADQLAPFEAAVFQTTATPQSFGYTGEFTKALQKTERDVKGFWDVPSANIQTVAAHGTVLLDARRVSLSYQVGFGLDAETSDYFASVVRDAVAGTPAFNGGNHPFFSFNAFAVSSDGATPPKIVMGDGILEGYEAVGLGDVAPQAIYAHEFGHHIQYIRDYFADAGATAGDTPETTRYVELMADAFAGYYLTHSRGAAMNRHRVEQFLTTFYQIGDCGFAYDGHHGTPNQRLAAARLGFTIADEAQKQGHILTADQFHARFVAAYPRLVAPDAMPAAR